MHLTGIILIAVSCKSYRGLRWDLKLWDWPFSRDAQAHYKLFQKALSENPLSVLHGWSGKIIKMVWKHECLVKQRAQLQPWQQMGEFNGMIPALRMEMCTKGKRVQNSFVQIIVCTWGKWAILVWMDEKLLWNWTLSIVTWTLAWSRVYWVNSVHIFLES